MDSALLESFKKFAIHGDTKATGKDITNKNFSKLCKDCGIINKACTSTDVDIVFSKYKTKGARTITPDQFLQCIDELANKRFKSVSNEDERRKKIRELVEQGSPANKGTKQSKTGNVDKMTDTSQYTGSHKERFDKSGKGKGMSGREELVENTGYVGNYKGQGTFDSK